MVIETQRLILRELAAEDFDALYEIVSDAQTMQHYPKPFDAEKTRNWITWNQENYRNLGFGLWAVVRKDSGEFIGDCGMSLQNIDGEMLPEIGYHIHKKYWRQGFSSEAARAVRDWAFRNTKYDILYSYMKYTNVGSYSTAIANGMRKVKEYPDPKNTISYAYAITRQEWAQRHQVIHIYGPSGGGISTLGKYISERLGYYWMDTDDYFWQPTDPPFTTKRPAAQRVALIAENCEKYGNVVISGSLTDWADALIPRFTLAVRVETAPEIRMARIEKRERERFGTRLDRGGDMYENHKAFLEWAAAYDTAGVEQRSRAKHDQWEQLLKCRILRLDGGRPLEENFAIVQSALTGEEAV